jgi:hypothetical protein
VEERTRKVVAKKNEEQKAKKLNQFLRLDVPTIGSYLHFSLRAKSTIFLTNEQITMTKKIPKFSDMSNVCQKKLSPEFKNTI